MSHKDLIKVSGSCDLSTRIITHRVHNVNPPAEISPGSSREYTQKHTILDETSYIHTTISTRHQVSYLHLVEIHATII
jgi:hypothetical protein